jgi:hypothetical protein
MKQLMSVVIIVLAVSVFGCAQPESTPADSSQPSAEETPSTEQIATEDFESGEAENAVVGESEDEQDAATGSNGEPGH